MNTRRRLGSCVLGVLISACGGSSSPSTPSATPSDNPNRVTIAAGGTVSPVEIVVSPGSRVLFINNDSRRHDMSSDPHPEHNLCPEINSVGLLQPGQSRETSNLTIVRTCGYHDHENPDAAGLKGRIVTR